MFLHIAKNGHSFQEKKFSLANKIVRNVQNSQVNKMETK